VIEVLKGYDWSELACEHRKEIVAAVSIKQQRVKRPMNSFMVWAQAARRNLPVQHPQFHNLPLLAMNKALGKMWR